MTHPTTVGVRGESRLAQLLVSRLLELGYNVTTSIPAEAVANEWMIDQLAPTGTENFVFSVEDEHTVTLLGAFTAQRVGIVFPGPFVDIVIWCWGRWRGDRLHMVSPIIVDKDMQMKFRHRQVSW